MKFCSACGAKVLLGRVADDTRERWVCGACGVVHYENPRIVVVNMVLCADRLLMCRRAQQPAADQWTPPLGFLEIGETLQEAAARETREETGVDIDPAELDLYSVMNVVAIDQVAIWFRCELPNLPLVVPGNECAEAAFVPVADLPRLDIAWMNCIGNATSMLVEQCRTREFAITLVNGGLICAGSPVEREYRILSSARMSEHP